MAMNPFLANMIANATGNLLSDSIEGVVNTIGERIGLLKEVNLEPVLKTAAEMLRALRDDNEHRIQQNKTKTTSRWYNQWLSSVTEVLQKLEKLQVECEKERSLLVECAIGPKLCEKVRDVLCRVENVLQQGKFSDDFLVEKPAEAVVKMRSVPEIKGFSTLQGCLEEILVLLSCEGVKTVVIWGPLGVGKTTVMQNLNNHSEVGLMFETVIWITMTDQEKDMEKLQMEIARRLKLNFEGLNRDGVAESISKELRDKKFLLLLDDVRSPIDHEQLVEIGVPVDNGNGSKVVLTTEARRVCSEMKSVREIEVEKLTPSEAWEMFKKVVTDQKLKIPGVKPVAQRVSKECGGLPLVIKTVASYFKYKDSAAEWRNGLEELRNGSEVEIPRLTQIHSFLKCCYDDLRDVNKKRCFLYGALHPSETNISADYLVMCWAAERFLGDIDDGRSFRSACDKGYDILRYLTNVSLLQGGKRMEHVQVNNVIRQVAIHISSEDHDCKVLVGHRTETSPAPQKLSDWEQALRIFMIDAKVKDLPNLPRCESLLSLLLQRNPDLKAIPPSFFRTMLKLQVLNICRTGLTSLPPSFAMLIRLRALFLNDCFSLRCLPIQLGQLRLLEVLDIRNCKVTFIPSSIGNLVSLKCLRVSYYKPPATLNVSEEMEVDYSVISRLSKLEELVIDVISYDQWRIDARDVILQQVASLENLTSLRISFPNPIVLRELMERKPEWRGREKLSSFWSFIGPGTNNSPEILDCFSHPIERYLRYGNDGHRHIGSAVSNVFPETDVLELSGHLNIPCLSYFTQVAGLNEIVGCLVERCSNMVTIVDERGTDIFPYLQQLNIQNMLDLKSIFEGSLSEGSLSELNTIVVKNCPMLTTISSNGLLQQLPNLTKLSVQSCEVIEELILDYGGRNSMQNLEVLELLDMKNLRRICTDESLAWPKLKELRVHGCEKLKTLPFNGQNASGLKLIKGEQAWWDELLNNEFKEHFQSSGILKLM